jgi:sec-independent protein translocase protein TatA
MPGFVGIPELILLAVVILLVFGPKRLPEIGRSVGKGMREFKNSIEGGNEDAPPQAAIPPHAAIPHATRQDATETSASAREYDSV